MTRLRIGVLGVYFTLFDAQMPPGFREDRAAAVRRCAAIVGQEHEVVETGLVTSDEEGTAAGVALREAAVDAVVFAPSMAAPPSYALAALAELDDRLPLVLWNAPGVERLPDGLTQAAATVETTQVACVMLANPLVRAGRPFVVVTARPDDPGDVTRLHRVLRAASAGVALRGAVALRVGAPLAGYADVMAGDAELAALGVREHDVTQGELESAVAAVSDEEARACIAGLADRGWTVDAGEADAGPSARLAIALERLATAAGASCATVNCHGPLLRQNPAIGIPACLAASLMGARGVPVSCTGDQPTALAMLLARRMAGAALYCELYTPEAATGTMLVAAGGEGDPAWADGDVLVAPNVHYPGACGHGLGLSFALERGPATLLSLSPGPERERWRLVWATGEVVETRYDTMGGPNGMFRFDGGPADRAGEGWIASGATHHAVLAPGRLDVEVAALTACAALESLRV